MYPFDSLLYLFQDAEAIEGELGDDGRTVTRVDAVHLGQVGRDIAASQTLLTFSRKAKKGRNKQKIRNESVNADHAQSLAINTRDAPHLPGCAWP